MGKKGGNTMNILTNFTPAALWRDMIHEAEASCAIELNEEVEAYLVFLVMRYLAKPEVVKQIIAYEFLAGMHLSAMQRELALQGVGDKCLLLSGLFPKIAEKRLVKISYFVNLGQSAYGILAKTRHDLYSLLAKQFVNLMDVLQSMSQHVDLLPLQAYDLWNETGSKRALAALRQYTNAMPVNSQPHDPGKRLFKSR